MQRIDSQDNAKYKGWCKLLTRKYREREGKYLLEGAGRIEEALAQGIAIEAVLTRRGGAEGPWEVPQFDLAEALFDRLSQTEHGREQIAVATMTPWSLETLLSRPGPIVALDQLQDPGNLGTIIRSADGLGAAGILLLKGTADPYGPKVVRAAAGSLMRTPVVWIEGPQALLALCRPVSRQRARRACGPSIHTTGVRMRDPAAARTTLGP